MIIYKYSKNNKHTTGNNNIRYKDTTKPTNLQYHKVKTNIAICPKKPLTSLPQFSHFSFFSKKILTVYVSMQPHCSKREPIAEKDQQ